MKILIIFTILLFSINSFSQCEDPQKAQGTTVVYSNGVWTSRENAIASVRLISYAGMSNSIDPKGVSYRYVYNTEEGELADIMEAATQKFDDQFVEAHRFINKFQAFTGIMLLGIKSILPEFKIVETGLKEIAKTYMGSLISRQRDTARLVNCYNSVLDGGKKLYAISHSQGGLFVNDAYNPVFAGTDRVKKDFSTYQIATPAFRIHDDDVCWAYGKLELDWVTRWFGEASNIDESTTFEFSDILNHGIRTTYLNNSNANLYARITGDIGKFSPANCKKKRPATACGQPGYFYNDDSDSIIVADTAKIDSSAFFSVSGEDRIEVCDQAEILPGAFFLITNGKLRVRGQTKLQGSFFITDVEKPVEVKGSSRFTQNASMTIVGKAEVLIEDSELSNVFFIRGEGNSSAIFNIQNSSIAAANINTANSNQIETVGRLIVQNSNLTNSLSLSVEDGSNGEVNISNGSNVNGLILSEARRGSDSLLSITNSNVASNMTTKSDEDSKASLEINNCNILGGMDVQARSGSEAKITMLNISTGTGGFIASALNTGRTFLTASNANILGSATAKSEGHYSASILIDRKMDGNLETQSRTRNTGLSTANLSYVCSSGFVLNNDGEVVTSLESCSK